MDECIFCTISKKAMPSHTVYEDGHTFAFLDIQPKTKGHTMVIPKTHVENFFELHDDEMGNLFIAVKKIMVILDQKLSPDGYNVGWNHGKAGGQVVPHLHIHIMPRWDGDGGGNMHSIVDNPGDMTIEQVADLLKN